MGIPTLDYGNIIRPMTKKEGLEGAFASPGFVLAHPPSVPQGLRVAVQRPADIASGATCMSLP